MTTVYQDGMIGHGQGRHNPHPAHTIEARDWAMGYIAARKLERLTLKILSKGKL